MFKKALVGLLLTATVASGVYWFIYNKQLHSPISNAINAIPSNASIILESKKTKKTWNKLSQTNVMWEELLSTKMFSKLNAQAHLIDSLIQSNLAIADLLDKNPVFISAHLSGANTFDFLYVYSLPNIKTKATVQNFIKSVNGNNAPSLRNYDGVNINTITPKVGESLSYIIHKGIFILSTKQNLIESSIRQVAAGNSLMDDKNFHKIITTAGKNVDANLYVNYKNVPGILNTFISSRVKKETKSLSDFANFSGWDITVKPNALMLSGFTQANDSANNFLNIFRAQKPQEIELTDIIPAKTALLLFYGISNIKNYQSDYQKYLLKKRYSSRYKKHIETTNKKYNIDVEQVMLEWIDNEIALVVTEPSTSSNYKNNSYAVIHSNNIDDAKKTLNQLSNTINEKNQAKLETKKYRDHTITHLNLPNILPVLFGWQFDKITNNYYTSIEDYIVFANSAKALESFIFKYENHKTLGNDKNYQTFSDNISSEANIYIYSSIARSTDIYSAFVNQKLSQEIGSNLQLFNKFEAVGLQFTATNKLFYSNGYLKYNPQYKKESGTIWESKLDTTVNSKPYLVTNHNTRAKEIFVQDAANKIYLISNTGKIIWAKKLDQKIMSKVIQIDVYKNKKLQYLFNTKNAIHLYDRNGNAVKGFPVQLKSPATNGISVFDYDHNRNYRIFVADEAKNIICYRANGIKIKEFKFEGTKNIVNLPIQYFIVKNKDHLCVVDKKGEIYVFNRRGKQLVDMKKRLANETRSFFVEVGKDRNHTYIVTADTIGNVIKVNLKNDRESIKLQNFESSPHFDYRDINHDNIKEYIMLTNSELRVFSKNKSLLFHHTFNVNVVPEPLFFLFPGGKGKIGVISKEKNELFLFNDNGSVYKGFPYTGSTPFTIGDLNNEGLYNLVTGGFDSSIYVYQLE